MLTALLITGFAHSQSQEIASGDSIPWELRKQSFIYSSALAFNDPAVAKMAIYNLLAENPNNVALYDSLALLYIQYDQTASAALVAQQSLRIAPQNQFAMELAAVSLDQLGAKDKALDYYEKLYLANGDINTLYKISFIQMEAGRFTESSTSADIVISDPTSDESTITFPTTDGGGQEVKLKAAAHRIKAMILQEQGDVEGAKAKYLEVLEMHPGFQIVQQQLRNLTQPDKEE